MKRREQALLLLAKAAQDESLPDAVMDVDTVADEVFGFHCQQAAEKRIKALGMDRQKARATLRLLRVWVEKQIEAAIQVPMNPKTLLF